MQRVIRMRILFCCLCLTLVCDVSEAAPPSLYDGHSLQLKLNFNPPLEMGKARDVAKAENTPAWQQSMSYEKSVKNEKRQRTKDSAEQKVSEKIEQKAAQTDSTPKPGEHEPKDSIDVDEPVLKVFILPFTIDIETSDIGKTVVDYAASILNSRTGYQVITTEDINRMFAMEQYKDMLMCDDVHCAVDIGGALGADRILTGSIGKFGKVYVLSLQWVDALYQHVLARQSEEFYTLDDLILALKRSLRELLQLSQDVDTTSRERKKDPSFWTLELRGVSVSMFGDEAYDTGWGSSAQFSWGGRYAGGDNYYYLVAGLNMAHAAGRTKELYSYERTQTTLFAGFRLAIPLNSGKRFRAYAGAMVGPVFSKYIARSVLGLRSEGILTAFEAQLPFGLWYRFHYHHSLVFGGRYRVQFAGSGVDPVSELVKIGSSVDRLQILQAEFGWVLHF